MVLGLALGLEFCRAQQSWKLKFRQLKFRQLKVRHLHGSGNELERIAGDEEGAKA